MGPKCYAVQCIVNGEENPQNCPISLEIFATLPEEDRVMVIGNMRKNLVKILRVVSEISWWTDRHTDIHADRNYCHKLNNHLFNGSDVGTS